MNTSGLNAPREFLVKNSHAILKFGAKMPANAIALAHFCLNFNTNLLAGYERGISSFY